MSIVAYRYALIAPAVNQRGETNMDFIERLFGFAPDGGNGMFELLLFAIPIAGIVILAAWRKKRNAKRTRF